MAQKSRNSNGRPAAARGQLSPGQFDTDKFINPAQAGGIEAYTIDEGAGRGVRALCFNTGAGLRYRVLVDRGFDIDHASMNQYSLAFLTHKGVTPPTRGLDRGFDWLKGFPGGLLTTCGPFNMGAPSKDGVEELGQHGSHSNTGATVELVVQPDLRAGRKEMTAVGRVLYGKIFGPCVELRRTITSRLGENAIHFVDEFFNAGNDRAPHAWLLHINFGYPLIDAGTELCYASPRVEPKPQARQVERFRKGVNPKVVPEPLDAHRGSNEAFAYLFPKAGRDGRVTVGVVNRKLGLGAAIHYNSREFPRCGNWQHWGRGEYVTALEPMNGSVDGRAKDRENNLLDFIEPGAKKTYRYSIEAITERDGLEELRSLNRGG